VLPEARLRSRRDEMGRLRTALRVAVPAAVVTGRSR
jgi:hypothetical protein